MKFFLLSSKEKLEVPTSLRIELEKLQYFWKQPPDDQHLPKLLLTGDDLTEIRHRTALLDHIPGLQMLATEHFATQKNLAQDEQVQKNPEG